MSYVLKALSNFIHESVLKTDQPTDRPTDRLTDRPTDQVSPRSDFPSLKKDYSVYKHRPTNRLEDIVGGLTMIIYQACEKAQK